VSHSSYNSSDFHHAKGQGAGPRVILLNGSGRRPGIIGKILLGILLIAVVAVIASFAVVFAAIFAAALLVLVVAATIRHLWRSLTGRGSGSADSSDSGVHFSGRIVVTSSGPVVRKTVSTPVTLIELSETDPSRVLNDEG